MLTIGNKLCRAQVLGAAQQNLPLKLLIDGFD